ncbi:N-acetylmuramoyl-L-alanine amidase [Thiofilum flexile]|uniref:N-acetylmuramoyl-L-alanine amidase n=1 Tax=Thiofilum flexile TaxID=125627 RepID=UPI00036D9FEA|nr:N-acetylmuramoyl-L-alanine amidase [Thiofilum flexile]
MDSKHLARRNFLLKAGAFACATGGLWLPLNNLAVASTKLTGARLAGNAGQLKFSLVLNQAVKYKIFTLTEPDRVVIDLLDTALDGNLKQGEHNRPPLQGIRYAMREDGLRVVLDMAQAVDFKNTLVQSGNEYVFEVLLTPRGRPVAAAPAENSSKPVAVTTEPSRASRPFTVVIDAGHGGRDPGAIGRGGTKEKDVVLAVARKLKAQIDRTADMRAVMTRDSDELIPLRRRLEIAHEKKGDIFVSIHADASNNSRLDGSSVYILSNDGASSEAARMLAESENSYDLRFGAVSLADTSERIASVLLDLSKNHIIDQSLIVAKGVLRELAQVSAPLRTKVESAGFIVLKSLDIPSLLVETAFISNPYEERRLRTAQYQQQLADALFRGVRRYQMVQAQELKGRMESV